MFVGIFQYLILMKWSVISVASLCLWLYIWFFVSLFKFRSQYQKRSKLTKLIVVFGEFAEPYEKNVWLSHSVWLCPLMTFEYAFLARDTSFSFGEYRWHQETESTGFIFQNIFTGNGFKLPWCPCLVLSFTSPITRNLQGVLDGALCSFFWLLDQHRDQQRPKSRELDDPSPFSMEELRKYEVSADNAEEVSMTISAYSDRSSGIRKG